MGGLGFTGFLEQRLLSRHAHAEHRTSYNANVESMFPRKTRNFKQNLRFSLVDKKGGRPDTMDKTATFVKAYYKV